MVLITVLGVLLVVSTLVVAALSLMTQESRIAEHKIKRLRAFFAAQAGMVHNLETLRRSDTTSNLNTFGSGVLGYGAGIPVNASRTSGTGVDGTDTLTIDVNY
ncbi:MAG: hypothetical protein GY858_07930 [Candidatus Omnitrophica bacterium]|nr:hypothetical protein [Candidatus Omnitrophota bacterium]